MGNHKCIATETTSISLQADQQSGGLTADELAVCRGMGLSPEEYRQANPVEPTGAGREAAGQGLNDAELAVCREVGVSPDEYRRANPVEPTDVGRGAAGQGLSDTELAVCRNMGLSPDEYRQANPVEPTGAGREAAGQGLSDTELAVCRNMGLSPDEYRQANSEGGSAQELEALIAEGLRDGRIAGPATAQWLRQQGVAACRSHLSRVPSASAMKHGLNDAELAVCRNMGLSPEAYRQANSSDDQ